MECSKLSPLCSNVPILVYHLIWHLKCKLCQYDFENHLRVVREKQSDTNSKSGEVLCSFRACICLEQNVDLTRRGAACVSYINTAMYLCQTEHSVNVPGPGVITETGLPHSYMQISKHMPWVFGSVTSNFKQKHSRIQGSVSGKGGQIGTESLAEICNAASQPVCSAAAGLLGSWLPLSFFALYGHKSGWVRERDTASVSEGGGVVYCFWRKWCSVTGCTWTFGACRHLVTSFLCPWADSLGRCVNVCRG